MARHSIAAIFRFADIFEQEIVESFCIIIEVLYLQFCTKLYLFLAGIPGQIIFSNRIWPEEVIQWDSN